VAVPLFPVEIQHSVYVYDDNSYWDNKTEYWFHPLGYGEALTGVCFFGEIIKAPADIIAAEDRKEEGAEGKDII